MNKKISIKLDDGKFINRTVKHERFCNHIMHIVLYKGKRYLVDLEFYDNDGYTTLGKCLDD